MSGKNYQEYWKRKNNCWNNLHTALRTIISTQESMADYIVPAHLSDEFDSFNPDDLDIFEEYDQIILDENNNQDDSYISEEDEDYIVNESDLDDESEYDSSKDEEPLDKNGKVVLVAVVGAGEKKNAMEKE